MSVYIHERKYWPKFRWNQEMLVERLAAVRYRQGRLIGRMEVLGFSLRAEAVLHTLTLDVLKSSEIDTCGMKSLRLKSRRARANALHLSENTRGIRLLKSGCA